MKYNPGDILKTKIDKKYLMVIKERHYRDDTERNVLYSLYDIQYLGSERIASYGSAFLKTNCILVQKVKK